VAAFVSSVSVKVVVQLPELAASCRVQNFLSGSTVTVTGVLAVRPVSVQVRSSESFPLGPKIQLLEFELTVNRLFPLPFTATSVDGDCSGPG